MFLLPFFSYLWWGRQLKNQQKYEQYEQYVVAITAKQIMLLNCRFLYTNTNKFAHTLRKETLKETKKWNIKKN